MLGAIAGDIIGSVYEFNPINQKDFPLFQKGSKFTDDSVLTVAVAQAIIHNKDYKARVRKIGQKYPNSGYGSNFINWLFSDDPQPYNSWGNGSAMRVSPVGFAFDDQETILREARKTALFSHNHREGIKGAQATAFAIYLARQDESKQSIKEKIEERFDYNLDRKLTEIRPVYSFDVSCQGTVPEAIISFLEADSWEDSVRNAVSLGGDADTLACITGGIAEAFYGPIKKEFRQNVKSILSEELWEIAWKFYEQYCINKD